MWLRRPCGSASFTAAVGLLLLALVMFASTPAWATSDPGRESNQCATDVITPFTQTSAALALPPITGAPGHASRLWPVASWAQPVSGTRPVWPDAGSADIRDPQQSGHRAPGSRSPPTL
ncbi:hypothetical protein [Acrocarpospora macrocephala]|nr:hypothetical protein [Acrocarpospora macrocephala]